MKIEKFGVLSGELRPFDTVLASKMNEIIDAVAELSGRNDNPEKEYSVAKHFQKAINSLQRIVIGEEKSRTEPDMRHDPEYMGCWVNVRILAQRALNELTLALSESGHDLKQMEEQI